MATFVDCPNCGKRTEFAPRNPWRPFCSERCKLTDLGAWATESYVIEGSVRADTSSDLGEDHPADPPRHDS